MEMNKEQYIELFRKNGFNCFPIPNNQKIADSRYKASQTVENQPIAKTENYGVIPMLGKGNCIIDFDDKKRYQKFAEHMIKSGYMVIETGRGWHIPVIGLVGNVQKMELFDYNYQPNGKIIEVQGIKHYCVGVGSVVLHDKLEKQVTYENKGSDKIWDAKGKDYHNFIDELCQQCNVEGKKKSSASSYKYLRERFTEGLIPLKNSSNDYFFNASLQCNTDELTIEQATSKIKKIYDKWTVSEFGSDRPWSNIEAKINEVYEKDMKIKAGRKTKSDDKLDRTGIAKDILESRKLYSNVVTHVIYDDQNGFLERINDTLKKDLYQEYPEITKADQDDILFKLESGAKDIPITNKDEIIFSNCKFNVKTRKKSDSDTLADMGFKDYKYLPRSKKNEPTEFLKLFENIPEYQHPRIKAGLRAIFNGRADSRISIIHGKSRVGKTTMLNILCDILGEYAYPVTLENFLNDRATQANIVGKRLVVFQDLPSQWKEMNALKTSTGEKYINIRKFNQDVRVEENKIKWFASANHLPDIKESEKDAMYTGRLSLIQNTRTTPYPEDGNVFLDKLVEDEAEKIISWIINLTDKECQYEDPTTLRTEWENISSPELPFLDKHYEPSADDSKKSVMSIIKECKEITGHAISIEQMTKTLKSLGYSIKYNVIWNISQVVQDTRNHSL